MVTTLDIILIPTYNKYTLAVADASTYDVDPTAASVEITPPGFDKVIIPFSVDGYAVYNSTTLGITDVGATTLPLPDGIYLLTFSISPAYATAIDKAFLRIEQLQERFDQAFMKLDMMECDKAIKAQSKNDLTSIYMFIQGAVAAANNCAYEEANRLYLTASKMLDNFMRTNCGCSGTTFISY